MQIKKILIMTMVAGVMASCASGPNRLSSPDQYAHKVRAQLDEGDLRTAESTLGEMELYYPVSGPTQAVQLELINAYYRAADMDRAVVAARRYTNMFPHGDNVDQVYYISGMANYDRGLKYLRAGSYEKSPFYAKAAKENFAALLRCCGESPYARDASEKGAYLDEALAEYEFGLMRAELLNGNRTSAIAKGNYIMNTYPATSAAGVTKVMISSIDTPEALDRLLIATALTLNKDEAEAIAGKTGTRVTAVSAAIESSGSSSENGAPPAPDEPPVNIASAEEVAEAAPIVAEAEAKMAPPPEVEEKSKPTTSVAVNQAIESPRYTVQLGSSRQAETVQRQMQRLGLADAVNYERRTVNGEEWHAALYGSYSDQAAAQAAADELKARTGVKVTWVRRLINAPVEPRAVMAVANEPAKTRASEVAKARPAGKFAIQVASYHDLDSLRAEMRDLKLEEQIEYRRRIVDNKTIYSALYGAYDDMKSARAELPELQSRIKRKGLWVRPLNDNQNFEVE